MKLIHRYTRTSPYIFILQIIHILTIYHSSNLIHEFFYTEYNDTNIILLK